MMTEKRKSDAARGRPAKGVEKDAQAQSEINHKGASNDGVPSADPRVISGRADGDATFPLEQDKGTGR